MSDRIEKILLQLDLDTSQLVINLQKANDKIELLQKQQATARLELKKMEEAGIQTGATYDNLVRQINGYDVSLKVASDEARNYTKQLKLVEQANKSQEGSLNEQKALLSILTAQYNQLSEEERLNSEAGKKLGAEILKITDNLKAQEQAIGNARRNVGNYQAAITAAFESFNKAKGNVNDVKLAIDQLNQKFKEGSISEQQYNTELGQLNQQLQESQSETDILGKKLDDLKNIVTENGEGFKSLRQRLREARDEATLAQDKFSAGLIPEEELIKAQKNVAKLSDEVGDFNRRVEALNPDAKFKAFTQLASGAAGAIGTVTGAMGLLGGESEDTAQALLKVQQFMQFTQGLNQLGELADTFDNVRVVLGFTTAATQANTIAEGKNVIAKEANIVVTEGTVVAEEAATVATKGLTASMAGLAIPLTILAIVAGGVLASLNAFRETNFAGETRSIADAVKQENAEHERTIRLLSDVNKSQVTQAENALKQAQANKQLQLSKATTTTEKEQVVKNNAPEIQALEDELLKIKLDALAKEEDANNKHLINLQVQRDNAGIERITGATQEARDAATKAEQEANDEIDAIREKNAAITNEERKLNTELLLIPKQREQERIEQEKDFDNRRKDALNQASLIRIGLIKDAEQRELAAEREQNKQKITKLLEDERANSELIVAEKQASQQRILDIVKKFALQEIQERNALEVAATVEGTEERIQAEISASERLTQFQRQNDLLTENEKLQIERDTITKIAELRSKLIDVDTDISNQQIQAAQQRANTIIEIERSRAQTPFSQANVNLKQIQADLNFELELIEQSNRDKVGKLQLLLQQELELHRSGKSQQEQATQEFKDEELRITTEVNNQIDEQNQISSDKAVQVTVQAQTETNNAIRDLGDERINILIQNKELELQAASVGVDDTLTLSRQLLELQRQDEITKAEQTVIGEEDKQKRIAAINKRYRDADLKLTELNERQKLQVVSDGLGQAASLFKKHTAAYKILATAQAIINTYLNATQAYNVGLQAGYPVGLVLGPVMAALAVVAGLGNIAQINGVQFYSGGFDRRYGYTGDGDPRSVSQSHSTIDRTIHKEEYVIDHKTLRDPMVNSFVHDIIEPKRLGRLSLSASSFSRGVSVKSGFAQGGFSPATVILSPSSTSPVNIDMNALSDAVLGATREAFANVQIVTNVRDINTEQGIINRVQDRANF